MKQLLPLLFLACVPCLSQTPLSTEQPQQKTSLFKHLDISLTTGTTGIGFDVATSIKDILQVRAGFAAMPHFNYDMHFGVQVGDNPKESKDKFKRLSGLLEDVTGYKVDNSVRMIGQPTFHHFNLMVDVMPFKNKKWHLTAGVFVGPEKFAQAYNSTEDMPSLVAVGLYNTLYNKVASSPVLNDPNYFRTHSLYEVIKDIELLQTLGIDFDEYDILNDYGLDPENNPIKNTYERIYNYGRMAIHVGDYSHDILYEEDEYYEENVYYTDSDWEWGPDGELIIHHQAGDIEHAKGDIKHKKGEVKIAKGSPYMMTPDENSMVSANFIVNNVRPYLGFGYGGKLSKNDDSWKISFDCGAMFWGGMPKIINHEGVDLCRDLDNIRGDVGTRVRFFKKFWAYPVLNIRITKRLW